MILCLSKIPNKELNGQEQGRSKDRRGWQTERISRRKRKEEEKQQGNKGRRLSGASYPATHGVRVRIRDTEGKSPEAKGKQDNLRKAGKKQAKLRPGDYNKE